MNLFFFPGMNACWNAASTVSLVSGFLFIRRRQIKTHILCMTLACLASVLFLADYLFYHYHHGSTPYPGIGLIRTVISPS